MRHLYHMIAQVQKKQKTEAYGFKQALCAVTAELCSLRSMNESHLEGFQGAVGRHSLYQKQSNQPLPANPPATASCCAHKGETASLFYEQFISRRVFLHVRPCLNGKAVKGSRFTCTSLTNAPPAVSSPHAATAPSPTSPTAASSTSQPVSTDIAVAAEPLIGLINRGSAAAAPSSPATSPSAKPTTPHTTKSSPASQTAGRSSAKTSPSSTATRSSVATSSATPSPSTKVASPLSAKPTVSHQSHMAAPTTKPSLPPKSASPVVRIAESPLRSVNLSPLNRIPLRCSSSQVHPVDLISRTSAASVQPPKLERQQQQAMSEEERDKLVAALLYIRSKLNGSINPVATFKVIQRALSKMARSVESMEAEYKMLKLAGHVHTVPIPELRPEVVEVLQGAILGH
ncbi:hypothetical protein HDU81_007160 [Chytriomyces hyalinus]|nr:hypothetical protein HDU81_007160 [Chytriomyces hyalinus]